MKPWTGDLDGMIKRRLIRVLTVYSKTFYFTDKGTQRGSTYDLFRLFEEDLNKKLAKEKKQKHLKLQVMFIPVARSDLLQALVAGKGDIAAANLTITVERQKLVDFASPVYPNVSELVVSGPASPAVSSVDDLAGREVFVRRSSSYYESLVALNQRFITEKKPTVIIKEAPETLEDEDLIEMVSAGLIPLIVVDKHKVDFWKQIFPKIKVHDGVAVRTGGDIAWALRKGSPQLKATADDFIARHGKGTTAGNIILMRYLKNAKYVKDAASESERKKFLALIQYFQKYGDKYDVDWLLMGAQGYQESQLNQAARSKVGAIGVMQVMPATGKELGVGDITEVEPNIHAGIKYMRWMIDQYYGNEPMTKLDKALFAFASYNAGAGRISQLRKEAAKRGLNPNVWFHNVEYVAAEKIGAETVTYVANIYKYYIAYSLIIEAMAEREKAAEKIKGQSK
jgi:membrane-bound lytic murein transglycosylase MltF